jgi:hypothetical protein
MTYNETSNGEPSILLPSVHMNGTSRQELLSLNFAALRAIDAALTALRAAAPNARDFYVQGDYAFTVARAEHRCRVAALEQVREEQEKIVAHLAP